MTQPPPFGNQRQPFPPPNSGAPVQGQGQPHPQVHGGMRPPNPGRPFAPPNGNLGRPPMQQMPQQPVQQFAPSGGRPPFQGPNGPNVQRPIMQSPGQAPMSQPARPPFNPQGQPPYQQFARPAPSAAFNPQQQRPAGPQFPMNAAVPNPRPPVQYNNNGQQQQQFQGPPAPGVNGLVNGMQNLQVQQQEQQSPLQPPNNMNGVPPPTSSNRAKRVYNSAAGGVPASQPFSPSSTTNNYPNNSPAAPMQQQPMQQPASYPPQGNGAPAPGSARSGGYSNTPVSSQNKIDPSQIPSPVVLFQTEQEYFTQNPYYTNPKRFTDISPPSPPSSVLEYFVIDDGNCSPRFMRSTTYALPTTADLANTLNIPLGLIIQPLAELREDEVPLQVVDFGETGPIRCSSCRGYINCHVTFIDGGRRFRCNICSQENEVPNEYFCNLDAQGVRCDIDSRPELKYGSVEFTVPADFIIRQPVPLSYVFALDVSFQAIQSGLLKCAIQAVKEAIYRLPVYENRHINKIAIITFDKNIHFYNMSSKLSQPQMLVVPEVLDVFSPLSEGFLVNPTDAKASIDGLLEMIPKIFENNRIPESCLFSAIKAVELSLKSCGGRLFVFQSALANAGLNALKPRDDSKLLGSDKEKNAYAPQDGSYKQLGEECASSGLSVDIFVASNSSVDLASVSIVSTLTSGSLYHYNNFNFGKDSSRFIEDLVKMIKRPYGYDGMMRVRCSNGFSVSDHLGNFNMKNATDIEIAGFDSEKAIAVHLKHDGKLEEDSYAHFQCAIVYTTSYGRRLMRVHNLMVGCSSQFTQIFRNADVDAVVNFLARGSATQTLVSSSKIVRDHLNQKCVSILATYRKYCSSGSAPGQLVLPESLKVLPIFNLSLQKSKAFKSGSDVSVDVRVAFIRALKSLSSKSVLNYLYPRLYPLHFLPSQYGELDINGQVLLPNTIRLYAEKLDSNGLYLLANGFNLYLWLGKDLSQEYLQSLFQVSHSSSINVHLTKLPVLTNAISEQVRSIIDSVMSSSARGLSLTIIRQQVDPWEVEFLAHLVEDKSFDSLSYVDYLCQLHRQIYNEVHNT